MTLKEGAPRLAMADEPNRICGMEEEILELFLILIQNGYPQAEEAIHFLEKQTDVSGITVGITNLRDVLSHLCTVVLHPDWSRDQKLAQCANAEEHVRRAIMDTYNRAFTILADKAFTRLEDYKEKVIPLKLKNHPITASAPSLDEVYHRLKRTKEAREEARKAKGRNDWDNEWTEGIKTLVNACIELEDLFREMDQAVIHGTQVGQDRKNTRLAWWAIISTVLFGIASLAVGYLALR